MARKSVEISANEETRKAIVELLSHPNKDIAFRAKIIHASLDEKETKKVAALLGTSEANVAKWKKRFIEGGIDAIVSSAGSKGGRPLSEKTPKDIDQQVKAYVDSHPDSWTAQDISSSLSLPVNKVYHALSKLGITPNQRTRYWSYPTSDVYETGNYAVIGLYMTEAVNFIVFAELSVPFDNDEVHGEVITGNSDLNAQLNKSVCELTVADTIVAFSQPFNSVSRCTGLPAAEFYKEILGMWKEKDVRKFHVFVCSERRMGVFAETETDRTEVEYTTKFSDWLGNLYLWVSRYCDDNDDYFETILKVISKYDTAHEGPEEAYAWKLLPGRYEPKPDPVLMRAASMKELRNPADHSTALEADLRIRMDDGSVTTYTITSDQNLPGLNEIDVTTKEGFLKYINDMDRVMTDFAKKINAEGRDICLTTVKKN